MVLSVVAMVTASIVESKRLHFVSEGDGTTHQLSIFWLLPHYILLGVADVFTVVGMQEFYTQVPSTMRTIGIALYLSVFGFRNFLGAFLIEVLKTTTARMGERHGWFSDDPRQEHLDKYYWLLAFVGAVGAVSFVFFTYLEDETMELSTIQ
jgi:peptide/histidine transporter 3/4